MIKKDKRDKKELQPKRQSKLEGGESYKHLLVLDPAFTF